VNHRNGNTGKGIFYVFSLCKAVSENNRELKEQILELLVGNVSREIIQ
jgi:hypothetical protein